AGRRVASLQLPRDVLIVSVKRNEEVLVPRGTTRLERFDTLQVIGDTTVIEAVRLMLSGETLRFRPSSTPQK
ncbi:TrkA C-terminal domain-containing protein, partial [Ferroacidibacillus organovorans]